MGGLGVGLQKGFTVRWAGVVDGRMVDKRKGEGKRTRGDCMASGRWRGLMSR